MSAGIEHARGDVIITMDGDLQNDPDDIHLFLEKIEEGYDIVCGWRHKRKDKLLTRKIPSKVANWIIGKITGVPIKDNGCSLKAYRRDVIQEIPLYSDMHRFIPAMTTLAGTKITEIKVNHHPRQFGVSKYGISRIYKVIIDLIVIKTIISFSSRPLHFFGGLGTVSMIIGLLTFFLPLFGVLKYGGNLDFMVASGALLFVILSCFLFLIGILSELMVKTGETLNFAQVKKIVG
jgi:glycosyltransferase involved in cell wall biosynthesis